MSSRPLPATPAAFLRVVSTLPESPGQPGAIALYPAERYSSTQGCQASEWIHRPWMKMTGTGDVVMRSSVNTEVDLLVTPPRKVRGPEEMRKSGKRSLRDAGRRRVGRAGWQEGGAD